MSAQERYYDTPRRENGCFAAFIWITVIGLIAAMIGLFLLSNGPDLLVTYGLVSPEKMSGVLHIATPQAVNAQSPAPRQQPQLPPAAAPIVAPPGPLPDCTTVQDTTTACVRTEEATPAPVEAAPVEAAPAYESNCVTLPNERPCWLPADQPWQPPAEVPATPIVLVAPTDAPPLVFADSACASWHPPMAKIEGCP